MIKTAPKIVVPFDDKLRIKNLILQIVDDSWIHQVVPDAITLNGELFTLYFYDKKIVFEDMKVDISSDYIDVYLQGIKQTANKYSVVDTGTNIVISFNQGITYYPSEITASDFLVKGKIVNR